MGVYQKTYFVVSGIALAVTLSVGAEQTAEARAELKNLLHK